MRHLFYSFCLLLSATAQAATVHLYADNRLIATGTAQATGSDTTHVKCAAAPTFGSGFTITDCTNAGINFTAGTGAPTPATPFKITAVDNTDPTKPVFTIHATMGATPAADWTFRISYGSGINTGASQTKGTSTTGPTLEINNCISSAALSAGDVGHIHIRGNTGQNYTNVYGSFSGFGLHYTQFWGPDCTFILEGYETTAIPSDLAAAAEKTSTYTDPSITNPDRSVNVSAGQALLADTALTAKFPHLRFTETNQAFNVGNPAHATPSLTLRALKLTHPVATDASTVLNVQPTTTSVSVSVDRCIIGDLAATDDNGSVMSIAGGGVVSTATISVRKSALLGRRSGLIAGNALALNVDQTYFENYGQEPDDDGIDIYSLRILNNVAKTYSAGLVPTNQVRRFTFTDNNVVHPEGHAEDAFSSVGVHVHGSVDMELCNITGNKIELHSQGTGIAASGVPSYNIQNNRVLLDNATIHGAGITIGTSAALEDFQTSGTFLQVASGTNDANGSQVAAVDAANPAHSTFKLTGGSATNDAYVGMMVEKYSLAGVQRSQIWDYDGTTKVAKCSPQFATQVASGVGWAAFRPRETSHGIVAHNFCKSEQLPADQNPGIALLNGADHVDCFDNTVIGHFNSALIVNGEYNRIESNRLLGGKGTLLLQGGSWNHIQHNTIIANNSGSAGACLQIEDKSNVHNQVGSEVPIAHALFSKCVGNRIENNIFLVQASVNTPVFTDSDVGLASWGGSASAYPLSRANVIDYNVYCQLHASAAIGFINGTEIASGETLAEILAAWAANTNARQFGATNDVHSSLGTIILKSPTTGDFRVTGGTASGTQGSDGQLVGASRSRSYLISR